MEVKEDLIVLLAERHFKEFDNSRLILWAQEQVDEGVTSKSLEKLVDKENTGESEFLFLRAIEEISPELKLEKASNLHDYALKIVKDLNENLINQEFAFVQMLKIAKASEQDFRYISFLEIEEDLERIFLGKKPFREELNFNNQRDYIREEFKLFSAMEILKTPVQDRKQEYCLDCNLLTNPVLKRKYQIRRPFKYHVLCCEHCNSEHLMPSFEHFVKRKIIESQL